MVVVRPTFGSRPASENHSIIVVIRLVSKQLSFNVVQFGQYHFILTFSGLKMGLTNLSFTVQLISKNDANAAHANLQ